MTDAQTAQDQVQQTEANCFHCGERISPGFRAELKIHDEHRPFCCYGCLAIAETIVTGGLDNFYSHRTELARKPSDFDESQIAELKLYDDPELQQEFVFSEEQDGSTCQQAALSISGITCAACIWLLEQEVNRLEGVVSFSVNHTSHKAQLVWRQDQTPLSAILIDIRKLGYQGLPYHEDQVKAQLHKERRSALFRIAVAGIATMQNMMFSVPLYLGVYSGIDSDFLSLFRWVSLLMSLPVVGFAALPFFRAAIRALKIRQLNMDVPVSLAILGAFAASAYITMFTTASLESDVYFDSVAMFTFFLLLGRYLEMQTRHRHLNSDAEMSELLPATATRVSDIEQQEEQSIPAHKIRTDDLLLIRQGQIAPADGVLIEGESQFDESALTGEYLPVLKSVNAEIHAGTANVENTVIIRVTAPPKHSRVAAIVRLLDNAHATKPRTVELADSLASYFVAFVLCAAALSGLYWSLTDPNHAFAIVLAVLVVTCPCALSLATPTALTAANTALRRKGFLITKAHVLEALSETDDLIFDKTGTLTEGKLELYETNIYGRYNEGQALAIAAALEAHSSHPIAKVFLPFQSIKAKNVRSELGKGICGQVNGRDYWLGTYDYAVKQSANDEANAKKHFTPHAGHGIYLGDGRQILARFLLKDKVRQDAKEVVKQLQKTGMEVHILSGDHEFSVRHTALELGIKTFAAGESPSEKLDYVKALQAAGRNVTMVGDGINDLPVLSGARLSIAMGGASDLTKLNSDAILLNENLSALATAFITSRHGRTIIKQNIAWALLYNLAMLPLAAVGAVPPYFAALGMSLSSLIVVFNSLRLKKR
ncbi:MAG: copper-translocating P-type ATPase [Oleiphilus sp.]|nr:MAG: copper-translocating P-type ATPase [Oleiphilus sp.]